MCGRIVAESLDSVHWIPVGTTPRCDNQKHPQTLPSVPCGAKLPWIKNCSHMETDSYWIPICHCFSERFSNVLLEVFEKTVKEHILHVITKIMCKHSLVWDIQLSLHKAIKTLFSRYGFSKPIKCQFLSCREYEDKSYSKYINKN